MPRRSFAALVAAPLQAPARSPEPPPGLPEAQKRIWADVVVGAPAGHFRPNDGLLLRHLCAATAKAEQIAVALEAEADPARLETLLAAHGRAVATLTAAGVKLRLWTARNRAPTKVPELSPLERARLEGLLG